MLNENRGHKQQHCLRGKGTRHNIMDCRIWQTSESLVLRIGEFSIELHVKKKHTIKRKIQQRELHSK